MYHRYSLPLRLWCKSQAKKQVCSVVSHEARFLCALYALEKAFSTNYEMEYLIYMSVVYGQYSKPFGKAIGEALVKDATVPETRGIERALAWVKIAVKPT